MSERDVNLWTFPLLDRHEALLLIPSLHESITLAKPPLQLARPFPPLAIYTETFV